MTWIGGNRWRWWCRLMGEHKPITFAVRTSGQYVRDTSCRRCTAELREEQA